MEAEILSRLQIYESKALQLLCEQFDK